MMRRNNMLAANSLCSLCGNRTAEAFCPCTSPETLLCVNCVGLHSVKAGGKTHPIGQIAQLPYYKVPGYAERFQTRFEQFPQVRMQTLQQVALVDNAIGEFTKAIEKAIEELEQYRNKTLEELHALRTELSKETEAALEEVERTLVEDQPQLTSRLGSALRVLTEHLEPLQLFSYSLNTSSSLATVTLSSQLYLSQQFHTGLFASIWENSMDLYNFNTHQTTFHTLATKVRSGYIQADRNTVLIVGKEVRTLDLLTLQTTPRASLLTPRNKVGVAQVGNTVFAFGGWDDGPMKVCEKSSFPPTSWTPLPPMHYARAGFTPCAFKDLLYLASTNNRRAVESFSPDTETFTVLSVSLPKRLQLNCDSVAFVLNEELILLTTNEQVARWQIEGEVNFRVSNTDRPCCSYHPPLIVGTEVYIANAGTVEKWSLEADRFV